MRVIVIFMTQKEYKLLRMIHDAEKRIERITFVDNKQEIENFKKKYNTEFESLRDSGYVVGGIGKYCELSITHEGTLALREESKKKKIKWNIIWSIIVAVIGWLLWLIDRLLF